MTRASPYAPAGTARLRLAELARAAAMVVVCAVVFFPVYWMLLNARSSPTAYSLSYAARRSIPGLQLGGLRAASSREKPIARNGSSLSTFVAAIAVIVTLVFVIPAAYALSQPALARPLGLLGLLPALHPDHAGGDRSSRR